MNLLNNAGCSSVLPSLTASLDLLLKHKTDTIKL